MEPEQLKRAIEAILFAAGEPVETIRLAHALETDLNEVLKAVEALAEAKKRPDELERYYIDAMDYETLTQLKQKAQDAL